MSRFSRLSRVGCSQAIRLRRAESKTKIKFLGAWFGTECEAHESDLGIVRFAVALRRHSEDTNLRLFRKVGFGRQFERDAPESKRSFLRKVANQGFGAEC